MSEHELVEPFERLLADACPAALVREIERGGDPAPLWARLAASGFVDTLVPEPAGGAGLRLADALPLFLAEGRHALPVPLAQTMLVRALLARDGLAAPSGPIAIATQARVAADGAITCAATPYGRVAESVLVTLAAGWRVLPVAGAERTSSGVHASLRADLRWPTMPADAVVATSSLAPQEAGAAITAALLAGAMARVLELTVAFANDRVQFGKSIGKFQAIQHQLAVMAEHVAAARMAAEIGCAGAGPLPAPLRAALAKARTSEAAAMVAPMAHAIHGAIGITAELDLQLYTRRLHEGRADYGAEGHWNRVVGRALLDAEGGALDFMRSALIPSNDELRP
ncbi:MAG TPA: acyl-CoA dehydrogenase family protein [Caldimonas sp.]|nr:acyl-CoA dehydrogenase family protein [Caldimonas sp.]